QFRRSFIVAPDTTNKPARLRLRAFKRFSLSVNGNTNVPSVHPSGNWKAASEIDVSSLLRAGTNEIAVEVFNDRALPALWFSLTAGSSILNSDEKWESSFAGAVWRNAVPASQPLPIRPGNPLYGGEHVLASVRGHLPVYLVIMALVVLILSFAN